MWSFAATNAALRQAYLNKEPTPYTLTEGSPPYPSNITPGNVLYFWAVPTFCYQPSYPRTDTIRWSVVLSLVIRMVASALLLVFIVLQYSLPTMAHSLNAFGPHGEIYPLVFLERVLKLSASAVPAFLCMFYLVFHCHLNLLAELTRFADRSFYRPWWNSNTLGDAWRDWNTPVHDFCKRHIYIPLRAHYGVSPLVGQIIVFGFSAVMHEFMVAVPSKSFTGQATVGFLLQVPLIAGTEVMKSRRGGKGGWEGNVVVWLVFIVVGWPGLALIYYRGWTQSHL
jgi:diacylglycerol O-acyltransferase-1